MRLSLLMPSLLLGGFATAVPLADTPLVTRAGKIVTAQAAIEVIMPSSKSCDGAEYPKECRTAAQAAPFLIDAMKGFSLGQIGAMLSLIGVESVDMKFKHNVSPGREGQGTSNMMMFDFIKPYAIDKLGEAAVEGKTPNEVLALVTTDEYNFGSAPWFLREKCTKDVQQNLLGGTDDGWVGYMECIGVNTTDTTRLEYWARAKEVFGL